MSKSSVKVILSVLVFNAESNVLCGTKGANE